MTEFPTPWLDDGDVRLYHGDALEQLAAMPSESVQCIVTSPPFFALRDYGMDGQIGLEDTPQAWCDALVDVFREARRVLRSDGVMWLEVGDAYASSGERATGRNDTERETPGGRGGSFRGGGREAIACTTPDVKPKDMLGCPWLLAFALRADGWYLRSDTIWSRPNPMPESVTDRPTKAHSYVFLLTKSARYFYDADAIREALDRPDLADAKRNIGAVAGRVASSGMRANGTPGGGERPHGGAYANPAGRNARSVWSIPTEPTPFAHFATFPQALVERCIKAGTSEHGACSECGAPWRRITEAGGLVSSGPNGLADKQRTARHDPLIDPRGLKDGWGDLPRRERTHLGWEPSCSCERTENGVIVGRPDAVPCLCLDPFMGSGTTALVARRLGRHATGVELNHEYLEISAKRLQQLSLLGGFR